MENLYIIEEGELSESIFKEKVSQAKNRIIKENNLIDYEFNVIRNSPSVPLITNGRSFEGRYITYEILNDRNIIGHLNCFMDHHSTYIDIEAHNIQ